MSKGYYIYLVLSLGLFWGLLQPLFPAYGQEEAETTHFAESESFWGSWSPGITMDIKSTWYRNNNGLKPKHGHLRGNMALSLSRRLTDTTRLTLVPRVNFDSELPIGGSDLFIDDREERQAFTLDEAFVAHYADRYEIEAGKRIYSWKVADGYSPLDNLNPVDVTDLVNPEKIGIPSVSASWMFDALVVQAVWLPFFVPDRQPGDTSRWTADDPGGRARFRRLFGVDPVNIDNGRSLPEQRLDKMSAAVRLTSSSLVAGWDLAIVYRYGHSTMGVIRNDMDLLSLPLVYQTTEYPDYHLYGISFSTTFKAIEFHGELGYHDSRDNLKDEDYISYIAGLNYANYEWFSDSIEQTRLVLEYAGEQVTGERDAGSTYTTKGVGRGLASNIIAKLELVLSRDHTLKTALVFNVADEDRFWEISAMSRLNDHLTLTYGYQAFSGDLDTFFGQWNKNDRFYVNMAVTY